MPLKHYAPRRTKSRLGRRTHLRGSRTLANSRPFSEFRPDGSLKLFFLFLDALIAQTDGISLISPHRMRTVEDTKRNLSATA